MLYDEVDLADRLGRFERYPRDVRTEKVFAGWYHGTGNALDARTAAERGAVRARRAAAVAAAEQFAGLAYVLEGRFPPYRKWRFQDLPGLDGALEGDPDALDEVAAALEPAVRDPLEEDRVDSPYLFDPSFGPLG